MGSIQKWLTDLLNQPSAQFVIAILSALGWVIGIAMAWLQVKAYREQKQVEGGYRNILAQAQRDWQGKYTEDQIRELTTQFQKLEGQIRREIPEQARRVFLEDKQNTLGQSINELFDQYQSVGRELTGLSSADTLAPGLQDAIERHIMPAYLEQRRRQSMIYLLLIVIVLLLLFPSIRDFIFIVLFNIRIPVIERYVSSEELISYLSGMVVAVVITFVIPTQQLVGRIRRQRRLFASISVFLLLLWLAGVYLVVFAPIPLYRAGDILGAILSLAPFAAGVRIITLLANRTS